VARRIRQNPGLTGTAERQIRRGFRRQSQGPVYGRCSAGPLALDIDDTAVPAGVDNFLAADRFYQPAALKGGLGRGCRHLPDKQHGKDDQAVSDKIPLHHHESDDNGERLRAFERRAFGQRINFIVNGFPFFNKKALNRFPEARIGYPVSAVSWVG